MAIEFYVPKHATNDYSDLLLKIGEAARQYRQDKVSEDRQQAAQKFMEAQAAEAKRSKDLQERRDAEDAARKNRLNNEADVKSVLGAVAQGGDTAAEAAAKASQYTFEDPITHEKQQRGVAYNFTPQYTPIDNADPLQIPEQVLPGHTESGQGGFVQNLFQKLRGGAAPGESPNPEFQLTKPEGYAPPVAQRTPGEAFADYQAKGPVQDVRREISILGGGPTVNIDAHEVEREKERQNQERQQRLMALASDPSLPPDLKREILLRAGLTGAGATGAEGAQVMGAAGQASSQGFKRELDTRDHMTAEQQFQIGMRPRGNGGVNHGLNDLKKEQEIDKGHWDAARTIANELGFVDVQKDDRKLQDLAEKAGAAGHSAAMAAMVKGAFVKYAQGGTGVVSDSDMRVFWDSIGGVLARSGQSWENLISGHLTPEIKKQVEDALRSCVKQTESHYDPVGNGIVQRMSTAPGMTEGKLGTILQALVPSYYSKWRGQRANAGAPDALKEMDDWANHQLGGGR